MSRLSSFGRRLLGSLRRGRGQAELDEEIAFHIEMEAEENRRRGMPPDQARRAAQRAFGRVVQTKHDYHEARGLPWLEDAAGDARLALRSIARAPAFAGAIILLMALGIGANTAVYTVVDGVLLRPPPYPRPDEIFELQAVSRQGTGDRFDGDTVGEMRRWNDRDTTIAATAGLAGHNLVDGELAIHVSALPASHEYFDAMGLGPARGRRFGAGDEQAGAAPVAILSHALARRLGADVVGRRVLLGGRRHEIVGVLPEGVPTHPRADVLIPFQMGIESGGTNYRMIARLPRGPAIAQAPLTAQTDALRRAQGLDEAFHLRWLPLQESLSDARRATLLLLFGAVGLVLLVACANVAGLLLIKAQRRSAELAVRAALGAGPGRLIRQLLTEGLVYALAGGLVGALLAHWTLDLLLHIAPPDLTERGLHIDGRVLLFTVGLTVLTGLVCAMAPALRAGRIDLRRSFGGAPGLATSALRNRWRRSLLVGQLALCTLLLLGAGLLTRTLLALRSVDPGFRPASILALTMAPEIEGDASLQAFYTSALEQAREVPGVRGVALAGAVPGRRGLNLPIVIPGSAAEIAGAAGWRYVSPGYFELLGIPVHRGRALSQRDGATAEPVAVVNQAFARRHFPDRDTIGRQIQVHRFAPEAEDAPRTIVGVVGDTLDDGLRLDPEPRLYVPVQQIRPAMFGLLHRWFDACWLVDTDLSPAQAAERLGGVFRSLQPGLPFSEVTPLSEVLAAHVAGERFLAWLLAAFALAALCIATTGIYGLAAYSVSQRSREIAIRIALGASPARILRGILGEGLAVAAAGILLGLAIAWPLVPVLGRFLYGAASFDPATTLLVVVVLLAAAVLASLAPAARAARIDPIRNLRQG
ncbi:MAG TPA: ADOP family duplicated permease [Kofleriaceae bacterium]|nr:ADOP family duplicated permease [Kofleriaceae bacterium]